MPGLERPALASDKVRFVGEAVAVVVAGLFIETHFDPENALSDGKNMLPIKSLNEILGRLISIRKTINSFKS